jgi:hypothetical protein
VAIFGVGMTGITVARKGAHEFKSAAVGSIQHILRDVPAKFLAFRLNGDRVGRLRTLDVSTDGDWSAKSVKMEVSLDDPSSADQLAKCNLAADDFRHGADDVNFRCVSESDIDDERLAQVGEARFQPGDLVRPLFVRARELRRLEHSDIKNLKANLSSDDGKSVHGNADYDIRDRHGDRQKGSVRLDASDGRALIEIKDENGNELFHLRADDRGVSFNAKDRRGRELIKLLAGDAGMHLNVKADKDEKEDKAEKDEQ